MFSKQILANLKAWVLVGCGLHVVVHEVGVSVWGRRHVPVGRKAHSLQLDFDLHHRATQRFARLRGNFQNFVVFNFEKYAENDLKLKFISLFPLACYTVRQTVAGKIIFKKAVARKVQRGCL